jgi:hypothetical protein
LAVLILAGALVGWMASGAPVRTNAQSGRVYTWYGGYEFDGANCAPGWNWHDAGAPGQRAPGR